MMWFLAGLGFCGSLLAFVLSFIPPAQIPSGSPAVWYAVLFAGCLVVVGAPFVILAARKPSWKNMNDSEPFEPFSWQEKANK